MAGLKIANIIFRGLQFLWTLLVMALVGNMISEAIQGNPATVNYIMFTAAFAMLTLLYLIPATCTDKLVGHPIIMLVLDILNTLFFFCAAIALPSKLRVHSCSSKSYTESNSITNGGWNPEKRCREAQAITAFLWFGFAAFLASLIITAFNMRKTGADTRGRSRRPSQGAPPMAQV
ncbi:hypothetical protein FQN54_002647 [Arachnomyces sp. PD_36]|nr:hypothetical protein FQN54_002647 [Arachnomyces sp. PD_36]